MKEWQKNEYNSYDVMFTGHSWMGVTTVAVWALQFIFAVWLRLLTKWPAGSEDRKAVFASVHQFMGYSVYAMGLATCATGFQDMQSYDAATLVTTASGGTASSHRRNRRLVGDDAMMIPQPGAEAQLASVGALYPYPSHPTPDNTPRKLCRVQSTKTACRHCT